MAQAVLKIVGQQDIKKMLDNNSRGVKGGNAHIANDVLIRSVKTNSELLTWTVLHSIKESKNIIAPLGDGQGGWGCRNGTKEKKEKRNFVKWKNSV